MNNVPLRFYRDGQLTVGMGDLEVNGNWEVPSDYYLEDNLIAITLELDKPSPELLVTDSKSLVFHFWFFAEGWFITRYTVYELMYGSDLDDKFDSSLKLICVRYTPDGAVDPYNPDNPSWATDETEPDFLSTGQANPEFVPSDEPTADDTPATSTSTVTPEPVSTPPTQTPTSGPVTTPTGPVDSSNSTSSGSAPLADINSQIKDVWYIGDLRDDVLGNDIPYYYSVIEFNSGEVSRDGVTIANEGIAASKSQNPGDWGEGRVSANGLLSFKWSAARSWQEPYLSIPTRSYPRNQKIKGCFGNRIGVQGRGSVPLITRLCLSPDGTFNLGSGSNASGNYLIEGHAMKLSFSTGASAEFIMGAHYNDDGYIRLLVIGDELFRP